MRDPDTNRHGGAPGQRHSGPPLAQCGCALSGAGRAVPADGLRVKRDYKSLRAPRRAERWLSRDSPELTPGLHFPPALARRKWLRATSGLPCGGGERRRVARRWGGGEGRQQAGSAAAMDVTGPETDWRSTNFRQKLVSQM